MLTKTQQKYTIRTMATIAVIVIVLNSSALLSKIDQVILTNLQKQL